MLLLHGPCFPADERALHQALSKGIAGCFLPTGRTPSVTLDGNGGEHYEQLRVDATGCRLAVDVPARLQPGVGDRRKGFAARRFEIVASPLQVDGASIDLHLAADDVRFDFDRTSCGDPLLVLDSARGGRIRCRADRIQIEDLLTARLRDAARKHDATIEAAEFSLVKCSGRSLQLTGRVTVSRRMLLKVQGTVVVSVGLDIDQELNAVVGEAKCSGEGIVGAALAALIEPKLTQVRGRRIPLTAFSLGNLRLETLEFDVEPNLCLNAEFSRGSL
jgi:hypothetical protein